MWVLQSFIWTSSFSTGQVLSELNYNFRTTSDDDFAYAISLRSSYFLVEESAILGLNRLDFAAAASQLVTF